MSGSGNASRLGPLTRTPMRSAVVLVLRNRSVMVLASPASVNVNGAGGSIASSIARNARSTRARRPVTVSSSMPVDISVSSSASHCVGRGSLVGSIVAVFATWSRTISISLHAARQVGARRRGERDAHPITVDDERTGGSRDEREGLEVDVGMLARRSLR